MESNLIPELITEIAKDFNEHLQIPSNNKILFSGKFGKGKTTFITEFFGKQEKYTNGKVKYVPFYLKPVNYSVASNEDIFKYIKYDVILEFLRINFQAESYDFTFFEALPYYLKKSPEKILKPFIEYIPKVGKLLSEFIDKLEKVYEDIKTYKENLNASSQSEKLINFLNKIEENEYSIFENDIITKEIEAILQQMKREESDDLKIENVLIIDDLDRIDPEHIFRILNVFSAHFDNYEVSGKENKFGFDKIILVCDIENIRNIFRNKYGFDVDFKGYVDKFYSNEIFTFRNYQQLIKVSQDIVSQIKVVTGTKTVTFGRIVGYSYINLIPLIANFLKQDLLALRPFSKFTLTELKLSISNVILSNNILVDFSDFPFILEIKLLLGLFGGYSDLLIAIDKLEKLNTPIENLEDGFQKMVFLYTYRIHKFSNFDGLPISLDVIDASVVANIKSDHRGINSINISYQSSNSGVFRTMAKHYYRLLYALIEDLKAQRVFI